MLQIGVHFMHENFDNREAFRGVCDFVRRRGLDWRLTIVAPWKEVPDIYQALDGGIVATRDEATRRFFVDAGLPVVSLSSRFADPLLPQIWHDEIAIGRLAADHLIQRGFTRFGWFGDENTVASAQRRKGFIRALADRGFGLDRLVVDAQTWRENDPALLVAALRDDPQPIGCLAINDPRARHLVNGCRDLGIDVPHRVGVIGVSNDAFHCEASFPPLTSIELDMKGRGVQAARVLAQLLDGQPLDSTLPPVPPVRLVARESTGFATTDDPMVDQAIAFVHANARRDVRIDDVVEHVKTNRRTLTWKFRNVLDTTPHQCIMEARIEAVKELLLTTDLDTEALAEAAGFVSRPHMSRVFRKATGLSPVQFRKQSTGRRQ